MIPQTRSSSSLALGSMALLALALSAGTADAVFVPKSCPPGGQCEQSAPSAQRKMQPTLFSQGAQQSDIVVATPHTRTTLGETDDQGVATLFASPEGGEHRVIMLRQVEDGDECEVCVTDGDVRVTRNGQPVEAGQIQREGNQIHILGDRGQRAITVRLSDDDGDGGQGGQLMRRSLRLQSVTPGANHEFRVLRRQGGPQQGHRQNQGQTFEWRFEQPTPPGTPSAPAAPQVQIQRRGPGGNIVERQIQVAPVPGAQGQFRALMTPGTPTPPPPPGAPQIRFQRQGQGGQVNEYTYEVRPTPGAAGNFTARRVPGPNGLTVPIPMPPAAPGSPTPPMAPNAPHARMHAGGGQGGDGQVMGAPSPQGEARISGQVIIVTPDGQQRTINLGGNDNNGGEVRTFEVPGGHGQFRVQVAPSAPGAPAGPHQGESVIRRRVNVTPAPSPDAGGACCNGSCCGCCGGGTGEAHIVLGHGDDGGVPQVLELGDLGGLHDRLMQGLDLNALHDHLQQLGDVEVDLGDLSDQVQQLQGIDLGDLHLDHLGDQIRLEIQNALGGADGQAINSQVHAQLGDAMEQVQAALGQVDWSSIPEQVRAQIHEELQGAMRELHEELGQGQGGQVLHPHGQQGSAQPVANILFEMDDDAQTATAQPAVPQPRRVQQQGQQIRVAPQVSVRTGPAVPQQAQAVEIAQESHPRVMIGITMGDASEDVLNSLGVTVDSAIRVESVIDGLPAAEAGLKEGAIIVAIDGKTPATTDLLREVLSDKEPGDTLTLDVVTRGRPTKVELTLAEYDADALSAARQQVQIEGLPGATTTFDWSDQGADAERLSEHLREAIRAMTQSNLTQMDEQDQEALRQKIDAIVREHLGQLSRGGQGTFTYTLPRGTLVAPSAPDQRGGMVFVQPAPPAPPGVPAEGQWRQVGPDVEARLNDLSSRLDRLEARLNRIAELLEQQRPQRD